MKKKAGLMHGLTGLLAALCAICIGVTMLANQYSAFINGALGLPSSKIVAAESGDTLYYESDFATAEELVAYREAFNRRVGEESSVLLKNENAALPLNASASSQVKVTLFGMASANPNYGTASSPVKLGFTEAFAESGIVVNPTMMDFYKNLSGTYFRSTGGAMFMGGTLTPAIGEVPASEYDAQRAALEASYQEYSSAAIVVLSRVAGEGWDMPLFTDAFIDHDGEHPLQLNQAEKDMIAEAKAHFDKVIVLLNTANAIEIQELKNDPEIDAIVWIGIPGSYGLAGVGSVLSGQANFSGRLPDTYPVNVLNAPAAYNAGNFMFTNAGEIGNPFGMTYLTYAENIYVGYRYYETRYEDCVLGQGNAADSTGSSTGNAWNYDDEVVYPFGYGLSYTTFSQEIVGGPVFEGDEVSFQVKVTNTGSVAGKSVVQIYYQSPYTAYDKQYGIEKASVSLLAFDKTDVLKPNDSVTLTITAKAKYLASYDEKGAGTYILEAGDYYFAVGNGAHDALNNILAAKGHTAVNGNAAQAVKWVNASDDFETYSVGYNGFEIENRFADADLNAHNTGTTVTYLSRSDWKGTWVKPYVGVTATAAMIPELAADTYEPGSTDISNIVTESGGELQLLHLRGLEYDDPLWEQLIDQMSVTEITRILRWSASPMYKTESIGFIGLPASADFNGEMLMGMFQIAADGPQGLTQATAMRILTDDSTVPYGVKEGSALATYNFSTYDAQINVGATFSPEIAREQGKLFANDGLYTGMYGSWSIGLNIHRTAFAGRNYEYFSEDPMLGNVLASNMISEAWKYGHAMIPKHYAMNDQEDNRQSAATFSREQAIREIYLRAFEGPMAADEGGCMGVMNAFNRIGITQAATDYTLNTTILRDEWGFKGYVITDMALEAIQYGRASIVAGTDMMLNLFSTYADLAPEVVGGDARVLEAAKQACHRAFYVLVNSNAMNGLGIGTAVEPVTNWWQFALIAVDVVLGLGALCAAYLYVKQISKQNGETSLSKNAAGFYTTVVTVICGIVSVIAFAVMAGDSEGISEAVYPLMIGGIVMCLLNLWLARNPSVGKWFNRGSAVACLLFAVSIVMFVFGRMTWFMNLASKNDVTPLHGAFFFAAAMFIVTLVVSIVNSFNELRKK